MPDKKPLTKSNLVAALKEAGVATNDDLQKLENRMKDHVFEVLTEFHAEMTWPKLNKIEKDIRAVDQKIGRISLDVAHIKDQMKGLEADLSAATSRGDFEKLKRKVEHYHPTI